MTIEKVHNCCGCLGCQAVCRSGAIKAMPDARGFIKAQVDDALCNDCGRCEKLCPQLKEERALRSLEQQKYFAVLLKQEPQRAYRFSTTGLTSALTKLFLKTYPGAYVAGAVYDADLASVRHVTTSDQEELVKFTGSKYVQSNMDGIAAQIKSLAAVHRVLFIGTPCQTAGIRAAVPKSIKAICF